MSQPRIWERHPVLKTEYATMEREGIRIRVMLVDARMPTIAFATEVKVPSGEWKQSPGTLEGCGYQCAVLMSEVGKCIKRLLEE